MKKTKGIAISTVVIVVLVLIVIGSGAVLLQKGRSAAKNQTAGSYPCKLAKEIAPSFVRMVGICGEEGEEEDGGEEEAQGSIKIKVIECENDDDCSKSVDEICEENFGESYYALGMNVDVLDVEDEDDCGWISTGDTPIEKLCVPHPQEDVTVPCMKFDGSAPERRIQYREINVCGGGGDYSPYSPEDICEEIGTEWSPIHVDCEDIALEGGLTAEDEPAVRSSTDQVDWCLDTGTFGDFSVSCIEADIPEMRYVIVDLGDSYSTRTPNKICEDEVGEAWRAIATDCEEVEEKSSGTGDFDKSPSSRLDWCQNANGEGDFTVTCSPDDWGE